MKRLFLALWPNYAIRNQIDKIIQSINFAGLKKVKFNNLHVTLVFLGKVDADTELIIRQRMGNIHTQDFTIRFDQFAFWKKPKVLCLTAQQCDLQLFILVEAIKRELEQCGVVCEERPYKPHITLGRKVAEQLDIDISVIDWQAHSFCLVESLSSIGGVQYKVLQRWEFRKNSVNSKKLPL